MVADRASRCAVDPPPAWRALEPDKPAFRIEQLRAMGNSVLAIDLAADLAAQAKKDHGVVLVRGLVIEFTFTSLGDAVAQVADSNLPVTQVSRKS